MLHRMKAMLARLSGVDYADLRYESERMTRISYNGRDLLGMNADTTDGFVLRVLKRGGMANVTFSRPEDFEWACQRAVQNAEILGKSRTKPMVLAGTPAISGEFTPELDVDPRAIGTEEKRDLLQRYNTLALTHPKVVSTRLSYWESIRNRHFASTEGASLREELVVVRISGEIVARDGNLVQSARLGMGGSQGFGVLRNRESLIEERKALAIDLLSAKPAEGGTWNCILNPGMAGVFTHEAFGHLSEADIVEKMAIRSRLNLGAQLGSRVVDITADSTLPNQLGFYHFDDEGVAVRRVPLIKKGVLVGRLHSRRTAAEFGEPVSGHAIAENYQYAPIVRMGTVFIEPGTTKLDDLFAELDDGLYVVDPKGGQTSGEQFTFGAQCAYRVRGGKKAEMLRDINISGNLFSTLLSIRGVADDLRLSETGGCGKGQTNHRSNYGGPHILVDRLVVGGEC